MMKIENQQSFDSLDNAEMETMQQFLREALRKNTVEVTFDKADGTERVMKCTLNEAVLPVVEVDPDKPAKTKKNNPDVMSVFDIEAKGWRSFRWDRLKSVNYNLNLGVNE